MSAHLIPEDQLRAALQPHRVDAELFENQVRALIEVSANQPNDPYAKLPVLLRGAAALLPPILFGGGKMMASTAPIAPVSGFAKFLGFVAFPAISLLVLFGSAVYSVLKIRALPSNDSTLPSERELREKFEEWRKSHRWAYRAVFALSMIVGWYGGTWLIFMMLIVSIGLLVYVLKGLGNAGLANRAIVGTSFSAILGLIGQFGTFPGIGDRDIHLLDQIVLTPVFFAGAFIVGSLGTFAMISREQANAQYYKVGLRLLGLGVFGIMLTAISVWFLTPLLWRATPERIKEYVESFEEADYPGVRFPQWETPARWTIEEGMRPNLSKPRKLLATEMAGEQNPFVLGTAFRTGLVQSDQLGQFKEYDKWFKSLLDNSYKLAEKRPILSLEYFDWVIRAAVLKNDLTEDQKDYLAKRLHITIATEPTSKIYTLAPTLRATQLLTVIGRPVDPAQYQNQIHTMLRKFHSTSSGGFQLAGGFRTYNLDNVKVGSLEATSHAVQLMEIYGIPNDLDINWVRSYLRPTFLHRFDVRKWMAAATLNRLNSLPNAKPVSWLEAIYYERTFVAAIILVGLCIYATWSAPLPMKVPAKDPIAA